MRKRGRVMKEQKDLKNSIKKAMKTPLDTNQSTNSGTNRIGYRENPSEQYDIIDENDNIEKSERKKLDKPLKIFGGVCIVCAVAALIFSNSASIDTSQAAKDALKNKASTAVSAGTVLLSKDENAEAKDYTITHQSNAKDTKIYVWDYAAEDGDYVQVLVNGAPTGDAFMIKHKPKEIIVPSTCTVQIKGIKDGGGGITYAVRYDINGTSYFNGTPAGQKNTYTLVRKK